MFSKIKLYSALSKNSNNFKKIETIEQVDRYISIVRRNNMPSCKKIIEKLRVLRAELENKANISVHEPELELEPEPEPEPVLEPEPAVEPEVEITEPSSES